MEIEEVAAKSPEKVLKEPIDPAVGYQGYNGRNLAYGLGLPALEPTIMGPFITMLGNLYRLFMEKNASLVEINPLVITQDKRLMALDGKVSIDDNALFKHPAIQAMRDLREEEPLEIEATKAVAIKIPVVVRLQGTNAEEGRQLLQESGLKIEVATDLWEAAQKIVALTGKKRKKVKATAS